MSLCFEKLKNNRALYILHALQLTSDYFSVAVAIYVGKLGTTYRSKLQTSENVIHNYVRNLDLKLGTSLYEMFVLQNKEEHYLTKFVRWS